MRFASALPLFVRLPAAATATLVRTPAKRIIAEPRFGAVSAPHLFARQSNKCTNAEAQECDQGGCCDTGKECCGLTSCCIAGNFCCGNFGVGTCAPDGGVCCADGNYCEKGQSCKTQGAVIICVDGENSGDDGAAGPTKTPGLNFEPTSSIRSSSTSRSTPTGTMNSGGAGGGGDSGAGSSRMTPGSAVVAIVAGLAGVAAML